MTSPVCALRDQISADWEALVPPTDPHVRYADADTAGEIEGSGGRRAFFHAPPSSGVIVSQGDSVVREYRWTAVLTLTTMGETIRSLFDAVANEAGLLIGAIYNRSAWPVGVREVTEEGYTTTITEDEERLEVRISLRAEVVEDQ